MYTHRYLFMTLVNTVLANAAAQNHEQTTSVSRAIRMMHDSFVDNWFHMQLFIRGLSFAFAPSLYLYVDSLRHSVGIAPELQLQQQKRVYPRQLLNFGITHISIVTSADTTLPSHKHLRSIFNRSSMSKTVYETQILLIVNFAKPWFRTATIRRLFIISSPRYTARGRVTRPM
jgi:hypothetical protein